jgi:membrane protease YdiL (CAAX protease family)
VSAEDPIGADLAPGAQAGLVLALATLAALPLCWHAVRRIVPERNVVFVRWGFSHVLAAVALAIAAGLGAALVLPAPGTSLAGDLVLTLAVQLAAVAWAAFVALRLEPSGLAALGLRAGGNLRAIAAGLLLYLVCLPGLAGVLLGWIWLLDWSGAGFEPQAVAEQFARLAPGERLVPVLLGTLALPLCEELVFRAFLQPLLVQNLREPAGVFATSLLFAALHGQSALLPILCLSLVLGAIMLRTQRLAAVFAVHALHNGLMFTLLYLAPELVGFGARS